MMRVARFQVGVRQGVCMLLTVLTALGASHVQAQAFDLRTFAAGLGGIAASNGVAVADYNRDGHLDVYVVVPTSYDAGNSQTWNRIFSGLSDGRFIDMTLQAGAKGQDYGALPSTGGNGNKLGASWGDYDNDGWPDLYLTHGGPNQLYHNDGDGTFTDVTEEAGVAGGDTQLSTSALWFDADADGDLDLYVGVWGDYPTDGQPVDQSNHLFENLGDGVFEDVTEATGLGDIGKTYTTIPIDVNGDGRLDLYNANDFGRNRLYVQEADGTFQEATAEFGLEDDGHGMGLAIGDPNGDGLFDIYVTNITGKPAGGADETHALFVATEEGAFVNRSAAAGIAETGWGWGTAFFDLENDGDEDLFVGNGYFEPNDPNALFENHSGPDGLLFENVAEASGVADPDPARGMVSFDYDGNGRLDLLIANRSRAPFLYRNLLEGGAWLKVELEGTISNRDALGAIVEVWAGGQRYVRYHHGAQYLGQSLLPVHVGLGDAAAVDRVVVRWPNGTVEEAEALAVDQMIRFLEGEGLVEGLPVGNESTGEPHARSLRLLGIAPNPSSGPVAIHVATGRPTQVAIRFFDVLGRTVRVLRQTVPAGSTRIVWDGRDARGARVPSGMYIYALSIAGDEAPVATGRVVMMR